jgi:hypothetical protein
MVRTNALTSHGVQGVPADSPGRSALADGPRAVDGQGGAVDVRANGAAQEGDQAGGVFVLDELLADGEGLEIRQAGLDGFGRGEPVEGYVAALFGERPGAGEADATERSGRLFLRASFWSPVAFDRAWS